VKRIFLIFLVLLNLFLMFRLVMSDQGVFGYLELRKDSARMQQELDQTKVQAEDLSHEIRLLKSNRDYLMDIIRKRMNYLGHDEIVYVFSGPSEDVADQHTGAAPHAGQD